MIDRVNAIISEDASKFKSVAEDAARSGAYLYPLKGIFYFISHKSLWKPFISRAWQTLTIGLSVTGLLFFFTYVPQLALLAFTNGPFAAVSAAILVLSESSTVTNFLSRSLLGHESLIDTFDGTLVARGDESLVAEGRQISPSAKGKDPVARLGRMLKQPFYAKWTPTELLRSLIYLPLNFVPVVGTVMYVYVQGRRIGPLAHARYFQLKGWNGKQREEWLRKNKAAYTSFGIAAFVLEMIPFASIVFSFTNTVGAALWASDLERTGKASKEATQ